MNHILTSEGRTGRRVVRGALLLVGSTLALGTVFVAVLGFWDEAITTGIIAVGFLWGSWRRKEPPEESLSRRLSYHATADPEDHDRSSS